MKNTEENSEKIGFPNLFTIQLTFLSYFPYHFTIQPIFRPHFPYLFLVSDDWKTSLNSLQIAGEHNIF
jgi:hypothetical protein